MTRMAKMVLSEAEKNRQSKGFIRGLVVGLSASGEIESREMFIYLDLLAVAKI